MNNTKKTKIFFLRVADNNIKIQRLCQTVYKHFENKEIILITTPSNEAATYIDQLLWRLPEESFMPHAITSIPTRERIAITTFSQNINNAAILINLCPECVNDFKNYEKIYELLDLTTPLKEELSRKRQLAYQQAGYLFEEN